MEKMNLVQQHPVSELEGLPVHVISNLSPFAERGLRLGDRKPSVYTAHLHGGVTHLEQIKCSKKGSKET